MDNTKLLEFSEAVFVEKRVDELIKEIFGNKIQND